MSTYPRAIGLPHGISEGGTWRHLLKTNRFTLNRHTCAHLQTSPSCEQGNTPLFGNEREPSGALTAKRTRRFTNGEAGRLGENPAQKKRVQHGAQSPQIKEETNRPSWELRVS